MALFERMQRVWRARAKQAASLLNSTLPPSAPAPPSGPVLKPDLFKNHHLPMPATVSANGTNGDKPTPPERKSERLHDAMWKPEQEFPGRVQIDRDRVSFKRESQILLRIANVSMTSIFKPLRLVFLGAFSTVVVGITSYESYLLLDPACSTAEALAFTFKYSLENFNASVIWETREAELVAQSIGLDPETMLRSLDPKARAEDAQLMLELQSCYTMRSVVAGSMVIAQLLSIVRESMLATTKYVDNVYNGREPPLRGVTERIIRLAGEGSDVTEVSMARYGAHILPVYESPTKCRHLVGLWSKQGWIPCVWQVGSGNYGYRHSWAQLRIDETYMLRTTTGKFILCIEADATNLDRAHELQKPNNDVTLEEASQAYRMIERAASRQINRPFRSLTVFLGDSLQLCDTGGTEFVTLKERIRLKKEVDVLIDAKAPLLLAILKWCGRFAEKHKTIVLDATPLNYAPLQLLLERNGYTVLTPADADKWVPPPPKAPTNGSKEASASNGKQEQQQQQAKPKQAENGNGTSSTAAQSSSSATEKTSLSKSSSSSKKDSSSSSSSSQKNGSSASAASKAPSEKPPPGAKPPTATLSDKKEKLPRLIYYPTTAATINAVHAVLTAGLAEPKLCCVLINSPFGLSHLKEIAEYEEEDFYPICAAEIYDDYFRQVRIWTRMGHSAPTIQQELDLRFAPVLDVQKKIAQMQRATTTMKKLS